MTQPTIFYVQDFKIDLSQSLIIRGEQCSKVEPKVLKVLYVLAKHQNEVVTHQVLMEQVWQGAEVVPNALQRCIAILRKELSDDAKAPKIIATHPKIGYRLLSNVVWDPPSNERKKPQSNKHLRALKLTPATFSLVFACVLLLALQLFWVEDPHSQYAQLSELTRTDAHESHAIYSPNAQYVVFNRYAGQCKSHIWAKQLQSGHEAQLTSKAGQFGAVSFTPDGRELVFAAHEQCNKTHNNTQKQSQCWALATLDFAQALSKPVTPNKRYQCNAQQLMTPKALANHQYVFLQFDGIRNVLMHYNDLNKTTSTLYSSKKYAVYHFDYHPKRQQFALFTRAENAQPQLILLDKQAKVQHQVTLTSSPSHHAIEPLKGNYNAQGEYLLAVHNNQLFKISLDGKVSKIATPSTRLVSAAQHPDKHTLIAVQGSKDIDIAVIELNTQSKRPTIDDLNTIATPYPSLARSKEQERQARFIDEQRTVFISNLTGQDELWLTHTNNGKTQLTSNKQGGAIHNYAWSNDNHQLAWASNGQLKITDLTGDTNVVSTHKPIYSVLNWVDNNTLLVLINDKAPNALYQFDIHHNALTSLKLEHVQNAWVNQDQLIFSTSQGGVFRRSITPSTTSPVPLPAINGNALVIKNDAIYSVDKQTFTLNKYSTSGDLIQTLATLKPTAWKITDITSNKLLLEQFIAIDQELVILQQ
ncbi:hypothetical protein PA25_05360 [Pseudoalteromonas sp. A25]|uniref:winged helix-turn-helix domain-containing protein n=1 Tax=Pseudoalteromonas sp. A25 TaxID=116092 RepID=UPI001260C0F9|nr:winged helix-turn-helix domain-containing protein [Pseudoalteromonas sp. A25]BBN80551.1 hypothetical protein PA25_05360 [Pseudoalteromonas sp. A25]